MKHDKKNVLPRLKVHLLSGKSITAKQAWLELGTSRLAEYIRRCRVDHGMNIKTTMKTENGDTFAEYKLIIPEKVNRIETREYINVGIG